MGAGRPKSKLPTKTILASVRMTPEQHMLIVNEFGSIQKFIDLYKSEKKFEINSKILELCDFSPERQKILKDLEKDDILEIDGDILKRVA